MYCIFNDDNCYTVKEAEEGGLWRCETVSCGSSVVPAISRGLRQDEEFKASPTANTDISEHTNQSRL